MIYHVNEKHGIRAYESCELAFCQDCGPRSDRREDRERVRLDHRLTRCKESSIIFLISRGEIGRSLVTTGRKAALQ